MPTDIHPRRKVVCILVDGARPDVLRELLAQGDLPNLARWVIEPGGMAVGTTVFPSTTGVAYIPFLFGRYPGPANVPGIRWLDRGGIAGGPVARWRAARSYCGPQAGWINRDIDCGPSLFELVPQSLAICTPITRGLRPGAHLMPVRRAMLGAAAHYFGGYDALDRAVANAWHAVAARPFRKNDHRIFVAEPVDENVDRIGRARCRVALDENGIEHVQRKVTLQPFAPVILRRDRPRDRAQLRRQGRPDEDEVEMAGVIREVDALLRMRSEAGAAHAAAGEKPSEGDDQSRNDAIEHRRESSREE